MTSSLHHTLNEDFELFGWEYFETPNSSVRTWYSIAYETFIFSGGEVHIKIKGESCEKVRINCRIKNSNDLMRLILAVDALRGMGVKYIEAFIPYIPYARQDRRMVEGEPLSIKVFANILNSLKLDKVICYDAHSEVSTVLIDNIEHHYNFKEVKQFITDLKQEDLTIVCPDLGAYKKIYKMCEYLGYNGQIVTASKIRNVSTGEILSTQINLEGITLFETKCIVVDDLCEGGATFLGLAKALKEKGASDLYLFVSHGIFSKGYDELMKYYTIIGTTNSFNKEYPKDIKVINLEY